MSANPYDVLGVDKDASQESVKKAFKKKAQKAHPDRPDGTGSTEKFQQVNSAYALLSDKTRRAKFDRTGDTQEGKDERGMILHELAGLLLQVIDSCRDITQVNVVEQMEGSIDRGIAQHQQQYHQIDQSIKKREIAISRMASKDGTENMLSSFLEADIRDRRMKMVQLQGIIDHGIEMKKVLQDYKYRVDELGKSSRTSTTPLTPWTVAHF